MVHIYGRTTELNYTCASAIKNLKYEYDVTRSET